MEHLDTETLKFSMVTETRRVLAKLPVKIVRVPSIYKKNTPPSNHRQRYGSGSNRFRINWSDTDTTLCADILIY